MSPAKAVRNGSKLFKNKTKIKPTKIKNYSSNQQKSGRNESWELSTEEMFYQKPCKPQHCCSYIDRYVTLRAVVINID